MSKVSKTSGTQNEMVTNVDVNVKSKQETMFEKKIMFGILGYIFVGIIKNVGLMNI